MTSTAGDRSPRCLAFTDNLDLQLQVVCDVSLTPTAQVTSTHPNLHSWALWSARTICQHQKLQQQQDANIVSPGQHLAVLVTASWHKAQTPPLLSWSAGLLHQPGRFSSGTALNTRSPRRNHEKFKPLLASKFPDITLLQHPLRNCHTVTEQPWQHRQAPHMIGNNSRAEIPRFLDSHSPQLNWFKLYFALCLETSITTQTL